jgi:putative proteasome-type protease
MKYLFDAAHYIGELSQRAQREHAHALQKDHINLEASFILGGQISGREHKIYMIYPEGNYITVSEETPYLQVGETKYGKPILDRIISPDTSLEDAARCALRAGVDRFHDAREYFRGSTSGMGDLSQGRNAHIPTP